MTEQYRDDTELARRLRKHPHLRQYIEEMLETVEMKNESVVTPDDAEDAIIAQIRKTGQEMLRIWAQSAHDQAYADAITQEKTRPHQKKTSNGTRLSDQSQSKSKAC